MDVVIERHVVMVEDSGGLKLEVGVIRSDTMHGIGGCRFLRKKLFII